MSEQRLVDLETKFAHQDLAIEELQKIVTEQATEIDKLTKLIKKLSDKVDSYSGGEIGPGDQKPPHY
ncbi:MAG TPA: SlyX family protein [Bdellovibrionales bacterium]|nr:SlyX family protein [Bdellovibrionales bacterium]